MPRPSPSASRRRRLTGSLPAAQRRSGPASTRSAVSAGPPSWFRITFEVSLPVAMTRPTSAGSTRTGAAARPGRPARPCGQPHKGARSAGLAGLRRRSLERGNDRHERQGGSGHWSKQRNRARNGPRHSQQEGPGSCWPRAARMNWPGSSVRSNPGAARPPSCGPMSPWRGTWNGGTSAGDRSHHCVLVLGRGELHHRHDPDARRRLHLDDLTLETHS